MFKRLIKLSVYLNKSKLSEDAVMANKLIMKVAARSIEEYADLYKKLIRLSEDPAAAPGEKTSALDKANNIKEKVTKLYPDIDFQQMVSGNRGPSIGRSPQRGEDYDDLSDAYDAMMDDLIYQANAWGSSDAKERLREMGYDPDEIMWEERMMHGISPQEDAPYDNGLDERESWQDRLRQDEIRDVDELMFLIKSPEHYQYLLKKDDFGHAPDIEEIVFYSLETLFESIISGRNDIGYLAEEDQTLELFSQYQSNKGNKLANHLRALLGRKKVSFERELQKYKELYEKRKNSNTEVIEKNIKSSEKLLKTIDILSKFLDDVEREISGRFHPAYRAYLKQKYNL